MIAEKIDAAYGERIAELLKTENRSIEKIDEIKKMNAELNAKLDTINNTIKIQQK